MPFPHRLLTSGHCDQKCSVAVATDGNISFYCPFFSLLQFPTFGHCDQKLHFLYAIAAEEYGSKFYANGAAPSGVLAKGTCEFPMLIHWKILRKHWTAWQIS